MLFQLKPAYKLTQKLKLTPQMRLALSLLQIPLVKLKEFIEEQVEVNPLLDIENGKEFASDLPVYDDTLLEQENYSQSLIAASASLQEHLLRQLRLFVNSEAEQKIGELIIGNLDDNGYLRCPIEEIAGFTKIDPIKAKEVLFIIQTFDPVGVGARDLRECLLLQLKVKGGENSLPGQIVDKYLSYLERKRYGYIAQKLKVSIEEVKKAVERIAGLEPKPGRSFNLETTVRLIPDADLRKDEQGYEVIFNDWELPQLTINEKYKRMIKQKDAPDDVKEYLRGRIEAARSLIDAVKKRKETLQKIIEEIISVQNKFLDNGEFNFKPLTLEYIARRIGKHKSTVSRAISNKYLQTPRGILELRSFLSSGVRQENGALFSSKAVKAKIKNLIENENEEKPLTDQQIVHYLKQEKISVSRRTISKYRKQLKILSSKSR